MEEKIAGLNATVAMTIIQVDQAKTLLNLAKGLMTDAEKTAEAQAAASASAFDDMSDSLVDLMKQKSDALAFWDVVNSACMHASVSKVESDVVARKKAHVARLAAIKSRKHSTLIA